MADVWKFLVEERGIKPETLKEFGVEKMPDGGVMFPFPGGKKYRRHDATGKRNYVFEREALNMGLFGRGGKDIAFIVEGESDTLRLGQEGPSEIAAFSVPGVYGWHDSDAAQLQGFERVYVILDNDADYKVQAAVDSGWRKIRATLGRSARRIVLPSDVKDICEFFDAYTWEAMEELMQHRQELWHYKALDLSKPPSKPDWLVDKLICKGDLTMMIGEPGVGKSWLAMALAVGVAEGHTTFLGRALAAGTGAHPSRVLYVDEENPEALVPYRLRKLGLSNEGMENIRYLHRQGVRLDKHPDRLLDEAMDWEPNLIVLDSLTRLHTKDENHAGEVAGLFNDGINPLARETGATTLVLHHVNKGDSPSSFARARGSGDLSASIDSGLDVRDADTSGGIYISHYKSRWILEGAQIRAQIADAPDNRVVIITTKSAF